jgi:hypothetical protein
MAKKEKKFTKVIEGSVIKITEAITGKTVELDTAKLSPEIQERLKPFGAGHKIGDAASGDSGQDAVDSMQKVIDSLMAGEWKAKVEKGASVSMNIINSGLDKMSEKERAATRNLLLRYGILQPETDADIKYLATVGIVKTLSTPAAPTAEAAAAK